MSDSVSENPDENISAENIEEVKEQVQQLKEEEEEKEQPKAKPKRKSLSTEEKKVKKKEANKDYYVKTREKLGRVEEEAPSTPPAPKAKRQAKEASPVVEYVPSSPRTRMIEAYREARLLDQERKQQRYTAWFQ